MTGALDTNVQIIVTADTTQALERIREIDEELANARGEERRALQEERAGLAARASAGVTAANPNITAQQREAEAIAKRNAERAAAEAEKAREESERALETWKRTVESTTASLTSSLETAAENIASAADRWVGSIKERTQFEEAASASRLIGNAERQAADLTELQSGLENLRARGVTDEVLQALGIDNVSDLRQVRKLVNADSADLAQLTTAVGRRDELALQLATSEEDRRTRANITAAILDAAKALDIDLSKDQAASISNQFNIAPGANFEELALQILGLLSGGRI